MSKLGKEVEIKASADDFYNVFGSQAHRVANASEHVHAVEVHEGDWGTAGSVKQWSYTIDAKPEILKEKVDLDDATKTVTFTVTEGHVMEQYKSFKASLQAVPLAKAGSVVKITIECEKLNPNDPPPTNYLDFAVKVVHDVDAHLVKA